MENEIYQKLKMLIEALTHSGCDNLDKDIFKEVKSICKSSQENVLYVYSLVLLELKKNNSQIRLTAFQLCKELFKKSSLFREKVLNDLPLIFDLTTEMNTLKKLPPPKSSAKKLIHLTLSTLKEWIKEFGDTYKKLKVAYKYFENCKEVDFETLEVGNAAERMLENERQRHLRIVNEVKINRVLEELSSNLSEIESTVTSLSNCISLLLPPAEEFFIPEHNLQKICIANNITDCNNRASNSTDNSTIAENANEDNENYLWNNKSNLRECGIPFNYNLSIELKVGEEFKIDKTKENSMIIENAKDCVKLINSRFLPMVKKWIKVLSSCGERNSSNIKIIIDLKEKLENVLKKYSSLTINEEICIKSIETDSDDDYELEEVKKEGYEDEVDTPEELMLDCLKKTFDTSNSVQEDTSKDLFKGESVTNIPASSTSILESKSENLLKSKFSPVLDSKKKLLSVSPKSTQNGDLLCRKDENLPTSSIIQSDIDNKFGNCAGRNDLHQMYDPDGMFTIKAQAAKGLRPKKRRKKPANNNLTHKKMKTSAAALKILEAKNLPGLVDVVKKQNNAYTRLSKKLFKRSLRKK